MAKNSKIFTISINHHICPIFHAENNLSKLKFNFAHFIGPILTLRGPAPLDLCLALVWLSTVRVLLSAIRKYNLKRNRIP
jgi:hypothetical protein